MRPQVAHPLPVLVARTHLLVLLGVSRALLGTAAIPPAWPLHPAVLDITALWGPIPVLHVHKVTIALVPTLLWRSLVQSGSSPRDLNNDALLAVLGAPAM